MSEFTGVLTAMATPFDGDGDVDFAAAAKLATYLLEHGSDGLVIAGSTGEAATLDDGEQIDLLKAVRAEVGEGTLLICGSGTNDTRHSVALTQAADAAGADAMLVVTPYYNKPNPAGMRAHVEAIAASTEKPIILYNIPGRTVINVPPEQLADLATIDNVRRGQAGERRRPGPDRGTRTTGRQRRRLPPLPRARRDRRDLRRLPRRRTADGGDPRPLQGRRAAKRASELDATLEPLYDALAVTTNPIPIKASTADARYLFRTNAAADGAARRRPAGRRPRRARTTRPRRGRVSGKLRILPLGGLGEIGKNMTVDRVRRQDRDRRHGADVPDRRDARDRSRPAGLLLSPQQARRHRGDRPHPRPRGPRRGAALRPPRDRHPARDLRRPADDRHGPLEARGAQAP